MRRGVRALVEDRRRGQVGEEGVRVGAGASRPARARRRAIAVAEATADD